ncbi:aromatic compound dioxygenase [Sanghuangporus baumii]|uniref:Aromatic compound dioxygenase n=1 Tax=Sanghuangporus baumii TaxID=108892 RepID=A0A9Q5NEN9_SANBA|nr:aromatic compound dioxygenase [Sanghuangporus baumii]
MVHTDWSQSLNGTLIAHSGSLKHIGQMFFDEEWNDKILEEEPYSLTEAPRTRNDEDDDFRRASIDRSSAIVEVEMLGDSLDEGLIGFITIGIDMTADYSENYYDSSSEAESYSNVVDGDM